MRKKQLIFVLSIFINLKLLMDLDNNLNLEYYKQYYSVY